MFPIRDHQRAGIVPVATWLLIGITAYVFWLELIAPDTEQFIYQWALIPARVSAAGAASLYPFVISLFLHAGFLHIISNMWFLAVFGDNVEAALGKIRYLLFYLAGGVVAALIQFAFLQGAAIPILGASGAVAAVLGYYFVAFPGHSVTTLVPIFVFFTFMNLPARLVLFLWFLTQLLNGTASLGVASGSTGGVAWWAHIGGFTFGMLVALVFGKRKR